MESCRHLISRKKDFYFPLWSYHWTKLLLVAKMRQLCSSTQRESCFLPRHRTVAASSLITSQQWPMKHECHSNSFQRRLSHFPVSLTSPWVWSMEVVFWGDKINQPWDYPDIIGRRGVLGGGCSQPVKGLSIMSNKFSVFSNWYFVTGFCNSAR